MGKLACLMLVLGVILAAFRPAAARNDKLLLPIAAALESKEARSKIDGSVQFVFGRQEKDLQAVKHSRTRLITGKAHISSDSIAGAVGHEAFRSAVIQMQRRAKPPGANAAVNIVSAYKNNPELSNPVRFECHQGTYTAAVALRGDFVKLDNP